MKHETPDPDPAQAQRYFEDKMRFTTGPAELDRWMRERKDVNIVDVRLADDYARGHIPGSVSLPKDRWDRPEGLSKDKVNVLYCYSQTCHLAPDAARKFAAKGYPVMEMEGGFEAWQRSKLPTESPTTAGY